MEYTRYSDIPGKAYSSPELESRVGVRGTLKILLNGEDVTDRCTAAWEVNPASGGVGLVELLLHDAEGKPYYDDHTQDAAREWKRGKVEIIEV